MLRRILGCSPGGRAPHRWLALILASTVGLTGVAVLDDRAIGRAGGERDGAGPTRSAVPLPTAAELGPPSLEAPVSPPPSSQTADAAAPPTPSTTSPLPEPVRSEPAAAPEPPRVPWTASSQPLASSAPIRVEIPAVGVSAPVDPLGLNRDGTLEVPGDFSRAGWYTGRPTPGEAGPAIIVAHRSGRRGPGAFWHLPQVQVGQEIVVTRTDGRRVVFVVERLEQHRKSAFPTQAVYGPTAEVALRLITCGGPFERALGDHYRDNVIVFARMTGWAT